MSQVILHSEKQLVARIAEGDQFAFEEVFNFYKDRIYAIAYRLGGSSAVAEDMVQEVFLKLWINREKLSDVEHFRAYLFTIARNHIVRYLKKAAAAGIIGTITPEHPIATDDNADHRLLEKEYGDILQEAIDKLSPQQALVYKLSKQEGLKREEVATQLGLSQDTVKAHLFMAMKNIRAHCLARLDLLLLLWLFKK